MQIQNGIEKQYLLIFIILQNELIKSIKDGIQNILKENEEKMLFEIEKSEVNQKKQEKHKELSILKAKYDEKEAERREEEERKRREDEIEKRIKESKQVLHNIIQKNKVDKYKEVKKKEDEIIEENMKRMEMLEQQKKMEIYPQLVERTEYRKELIDKQREERKYIIYYLLLLYLLLHLLLLIIIYYLLKQNGRTSKIRRRRNQKKEN